MVQAPPGPQARRWRTPLRIGVSAAGLAVLVHGLNLSAVVRTVSAARMGWLVAAVVVGVLAQMTPLWQWALLLPAHPDLGPSRLTGLFLRATFVSHLLPSGIGGDAVRSLEVGATLGYGNAVATVAAGRLLGMLAMASWAFAGSWLLTGVGPLAPAVTASVLLGLLLLSAAALEADRVRPALLPRHRRLAGFLDEMTAGLAAYRRRRGPLPAAAVVSTLGFGLTIVSMLLFARSIGVVAAWQVFAVSVPMTMAVTLLPITVNGLGIREGVMVGMLVHAGVAVAGAAAVALYADLQAFPLAVLGAVLSLSRRPARLAGDSLEPVPVDPQPAVPTTG